MSADDPKRRHLGRGLSALLGDTDPGPTEPTGEHGMRTVPLGKIKAGPFQPRHRFDDSELDTLAASIREKGVLQPVLVRRAEDDTYEIVAGERRWRAAQRAGIHELPVLVRDLTDREVLEIALVENIQRADLSPIEEAQGYRRLMTEFGHTQEQLSRALGKSRSHVANAVRLLDLPETVQALVDEGKLSAGHARTLVGLGNAEHLARTAVARQLNVRQMEALTKSAKMGRTPPIPPIPNADVRALEQRLAQAVGLKVDVKARGVTGEVVIHYATLDQLDDIVARLMRPKAN